jgi:hypothetical protein
MLVMCISPANCTVLQGGYANLVREDVRQGASGGRLYSPGACTTTVAEGSGERAAALTDSWLHASPRAGLTPQAVWQLLADASRLGVVRHGWPEAWAAGAVVALARVNDLLGAEGALTAEEVADELDVTVGTLAVTESELARVLNFAGYAHRLSTALGRTG